MPKISVIMPLFNAQKYLEESLKSVLGQTFKDYELICINDGSNDNTRKILGDYQRQDTRIKILDNSVRLGAACSRNRGMSEAEGKYIIFLDGDDIFEEEMLAVTYATAEENDTDVLMFSYKNVTSTEIYNKIQTVNGPRFVEKYCKKIFSVEELKPYEFLLWSPGPCNKLFKKKFIVDNKISFQDLSCSNDVYFVNMALMLSKKTMMLNDGRVMLYVRNHFEPSRISSRRDPMCNFRAYEYLLEMLVEKEKLEPLYQHFFYKALFSFLNVISCTERRDKREAETFYIFLQDEGIARLKHLSRFCKNYESSYLDYIIKQFKENDFSTQWYKRESLLAIYIRENHEIFCKLFKRKKEGEKIIIWGAGQNGHDVILACKKEKIIIDFVVDISEEKQGKYIEGYCIMSPEEILRHPSLIIVATYGIFEEVQKFINISGMKSRVVDIATYLTII